MPESKPIPPSKPVSPPPKPVPQEFMPFFQGILAKQQGSTVLTVDFMNKVIADYKKQGGVI